MTWVTLILNMFYKVLDFNTIFFFGVLDENIKKFRTKSKVEFMWICFITL